MQLRQGTSRSTLPAKTVLAKAGQLGDVWYTWLKFGKVWELHMFSLRSFGFCIREEMVGVGESIWNGFREARELLRQVSACIF
jgi:hypothetical protein